MTRFLADENISFAIIAKLRLAGYEVSAIIETRAGAADAEVMEIARAAGRIIVTEDRDFGELVIRKKLNVAGVILLELGRLTDSAAADLVERVIRANEEKLSGCFVVLEPGRVRMRPLP